jgi:hypothetical protein
LGCQRRQARHIARRADDPAGGGWAHRDRLNSNVIDDTDYSV